MTASKLKVGDRVKITRIPPGVERDRSRFPETFALFQNAVGRLFQIRDFGECGHAEIWVRQNGSEHKTGGADSIWVELEHLVAA